MDSPPVASSNAFYLSGTTQTQVVTDNSEFMFCGNMANGGLFRLEGQVNYTDIKSRFHDNSAIDGGVFSCSQCNLTLITTTCEKNQANIGGVFKIESSANLTTLNSIFRHNTAYQVGGVISLTTQSVFNLVSTTFEYNTGNESSTIDILGASTSLVNQITNCTFTNNNATKNTVSFNNALASIQYSQFKNNLSQQRSKNLFVAFATVNVSNCFFSSPK